MARTFLFRTEPKEFPLLFVPFLHILRFSHTKIENYKSPSAFSSAIIKHPVIQASFSFFLPRTCSRPSFFAYTVYAAGQESAQGKPLLPYVGTTSCACRISTQRRRPSESSRNSHSIGRSAAFSLTIWGDCKEASDNFTMNPSKHNRVRDPLSARSFLCNYPQNAGFAFY